MKKLFVSAGVLAVAAVVFFSLSPKSGAQEEAKGIKPSTQAKPGFSEYIVVRETPSAFSAAVNEKLKEGFVPQGGISVVQITMGESYAQAMVR